MIVLQVLDGRRDKPEQVVIVFLPAAGSIGMPGWSHRVGNCLFA